MDVDLPTRERVSHRPAQSLPGQIGPWSQRYARAMVWSGQSAGALVYNGLSRFQGVVGPCTGRMTGNDVDDQLGGQGAGDTRTVQ